MIGAITIVRLAGFVSVIVGVHMPIALGLQYVVLVGAIALGFWRISRGTAVEPAPMMAKLGTLMTKWMPASAS
jgi:hypothetical protein